MEVKGRKSFSKEEFFVLKVIEVVKEDDENQQWFRLVSLNQFLKGEEFFFEQYNNVMLLIKYQFDFYIKKEYKIQYKEFEQ